MRISAANRSRTLFPSRDREGAVILKDHLPFDLNRSRFGSVSDLSLTCGAAKQRAHSAQNAKRSPQVKGWTNQQALASWRLTVQKVAACPLEGVRLASDECARRFLIRAIR